MTVAQEQEEDRKLSLPPSQPLLGPASPTLQVFALQERMALSSEKKPKYSQGTAEQVLISCPLTLKLSPQVTNIRLGATPPITPLTTEQSTAFCLSPHFIKDSEGPCGPLYTGVSANSKSDLVQETWD